MNLIRVVRTLIVMSLCFSVPFLLCMDSVLAAGKEADAKKALEDLKKAKDAKTKVASLQKLGELGLIQYAFVEPAIPDVYKATKDTDSGVRAAAAKTLGMIGPEDKEAVPTLVGLLKDKDDSVKSAAAEGLGYMGAKAKSAVSDLRAAAKDLDAKSKLAKTIQASIKAISGTRKK